MSFFVDFGDCDFNVTLVEDNNYLVDGNMETTETWNGATISEEGGYFGKGIVSTGTAQSDSKNYFVATSALVTGEAYIVTAKVKIADKGSGCNVSLRIYNFADGNKQTEITNGNTRAIFTDNTDGWATAKVEFIAGEQAAPRWHRIQFVCNGVNTTYIDEVRITKKSTNTEVPSSEILSEGFEGETLNATVDGDKGNDALDGANEFVVFFQIIIPCITPILAFVALVTGMAFWNEYTVAMIFIKDYTKMTISVGLTQLTAAYERVDLAPIFSGYILALLPIFVLYAIFQKPIQNGMDMDSGIKG